MYFDIKELDSLSCYRAMVASIIPRPIAWVSTKSAQGVLNIAPYSFFSVASCNPPVLSVTQIRPRNLQDKDTLVNLRETGECVVNIVSADNVEKMNASCAGYRAEQDEFTLCDITAIDSEKVNVPGVANARVRYECRLREVIEVSSEAMGGSIMLLDVIGIYAADKCLEDQQIQTQALNAVGKMGGDNYCSTENVFSLSRPIV